MELDWALSLEELRALWDQLDSYQDHESVWVMEQAAPNGRKI